MKPGQPLRQPPPLLRQVARLHAARKYRDVQWEDLPEVYRTDALQTVKPIVEDVVSLLQQRMMP